MLDEAGFAHASTMRPVLIAVVLCALFCAISWLATGLGAVALVAALAGRQRRSPGSAGVRGGFGGRAARCGRRVRPLDLLRPCGCVASGCRGGSRDEWTASAASCVRPLPLRHGGIRTLRLQRAAPQGSPRRSGGRPHHRDAPDGAAGRRNRADRRAPRALGIRACRRHPSRRGRGATVLGARSGGRRGRRAVDRSRPAGASPRGCQRVRESRRRRGVSSVRSSRSAPTASPFASAACRNRGGGSHEHRQPRCIRRRPRCRARHGIAAGRRTTPRWAAPSLSRRVAPYLRDIADPLGITRSRPRR
jgi:hypothetical protein